MGEEVRGLLANEAAHNTAIANLEAQILSGSLTGDAVKRKAQDQLGTKRSGLAAIQAALAEKFDGTPAGQERNQLIAWLQSDARRLFAAQAQQFASTRRSLPRLISRSIAPRSGCSTGN